ncbi:MAG: quinate 5-dehydrogenase [Bacillota bacterium]|nr:quinate 5-dehydrogenase [Bacillota bacterium]
MKKVVSVSLGAKSRDHAARTDLFGVPMELQRIGVDGDLEAARKLLRELDGHVDAIGLGGLDVYLYVAGEQYIIQDGWRLMEEVKKTPVVDGSRVKDTAERRAIHWLAEKGPFPLTGQHVLMVSSLDRFGMAEELAAVGADVVYGDLMFATGVPYPIRSLDELKEIARKLAREIVKLPIHMIYPVGKAQEEEPVEKFPEFYHEAQVIAGDYHMMRRYMPKELPEKAVITQTTTQADREFLKGRGIRWLATTTPIIEGRSFATNVVEAALVAAKGWHPQEVGREEIEAALDEIGYQPTVIDLGGEGRQAHGHR